MRKQQKTSDSPPEPAWYNQSSQLATAWLTAYQRAVQTNDERVVLFHPGAVVYGGEFLNPCSGGLRVTFTLDLKDAKILPIDPAYTLAVMQWTTNPIIVGAGQVNGYATFILHTTMPDPDGKSEGARKGSVLCVHAHYSRAS